MHGVLKHKVAIIVGSCFLHILWNNHQLSESSWWRQTSPCVTHLHHKSLKEETVFEYRGLELLKMKRMLYERVHSRDNKMKAYWAITVVEYVHANTWSPLPTPPPSPSPPPPTHLRKIRVHSHSCTPQCPPVSHQTSRLTQLPSQGVQSLLQDWRTIDQSCATTAAM